MWQFSVDTAMCCGRVYRVCFRTIIGDETYTLDFDRVEDIHTHLKNQNHLRWNGVQIVIEDIKYGVFEPLGNVCVVPPQDKNYLRGLFEYKLLVFNVDFENQDLLDSYLSEFKNITFISKSYVSRQEVTSLWKKNLSSFMYKNWIVFFVGQTSSITFANAESLVNYLHHKNVSEDCDDWLVVEAICHA